MNLVSAEASEVRSSHSISQPRVSTLHISVVHANAMTKRSHASISDTSRLEPPPHEAEGSSAGDGDGDAEEPTSKKPHATLVRPQTCDFVKAPY